MTVLDVNTRLSGTTGSSAAGQNISAATAAAPVYSTNWLDMGTLSSTNPALTKKTLENLVAQFIATTLVNSATDTATLDLEIVMSLTNAPATPTLAAFDNTTAVAGTVITVTAHGLTNGTRITVAQTSGTLNTGTGYAVATNLFVVNATTDTFGVSATPGGSAISLTDQAGTTTVTWYPEVIGGCTKVPLERLNTYTTHQARINPLPAGLGTPVHRYVFARYTPTANLTAGLVLCDIGEGIGMSNFPINSPNYTTA